MAIPISLNLIELKCVFDIRAVISYLVYFNERSIIGLQNVGVQIFAISSLYIYLKLSTSCKNKIK